jgi:hypothetical protein
MSFSPTDAALEGFRITRENARAFTRWVAVSFAVSVLGALVTVSMPAEVRHALDTLRSEDTPDLRTFLEALLAVSPLFLFGLIFQCMMAAAVFRVIFRHEDSRFGYLRFGADELRLMALTVIFVLLTIVLLAAVTLLTTIIAGLATMLSGAFAVRLAAVAELISIAVVVYVLVRLSLAPAATFAERRLRIFESWELTRGVFWRLFGAYVLALCCIVVVGFFALILFTAVAGLVVILSGGQLTDLSAIFQPDETSLRSYLNPGMIAYMIVGSLFQTLYFAVVAAPGALAYRQLHGDPEPPLRTQASQG